MSETTPDRPTPPTEPPRPLEQTLDATVAASPQRGSPAGETQPISRTTTPGEERSSRPFPSPPGYEILEEVGRGGMGVVYRARQVSLDRIVALKMIRDGALAGPDQLARFRSEAAAVARLQHPHIVHIHDLCEHDGLPFFPMEYVPGGSLAGVIHDRPLPPREAAELLEKLARAVHYAHQQGIVHRDLKPANVLLTLDAIPKISDFGLAKKLDEAGRTASGAVLGTPSYMAPEQAEGRGKDIGPHTDVYALGAILYEAVTGKPPFDADSLMKTLDQVRFQEPAAPSKVCSQVPADLETICLRCLQKEPSRRYPSAAALAEDLQHFLACKPLATVQLEAPADDAAPPGYEVWEEVSRGGLWVVYKARDLRAKRLVALKRIRPGSALSAEQLARLRATIDAARALDHPNVARLCDTGGAGQGLYIALEFVAGGNLQHKMAGQALPPADAARLVETLARALHHAHHNGLVHCALQMGNVLLDVPGFLDEVSPVEARLGVPKLIGFEMARRREDVGGLEDLTDVRPTSYAMAPEQLFGKREEIGPATDTYALGVMLYELLTGQPPYRATTTSDLLLKVGFEMLQPPRRLNDAVPAALERVCLKCLQKAPKDRYASAEALADDLRNFQEGKPTSASVPSLWQRLRGWLGSRLKRA